LIWLKIIVGVFGAGCTGGLITGLFDLQDPTKKDQQTALEKLGLRYFRGECRTWFPGLLGSVLLGGVAAVVFWSLYGPFSGATIIGVGAPTANVSPNLTIGQLASSLLIGLSGAGFLLTEAKRRCAET